MPAFTTSDGTRIVFDDLGPRDGTTVVLCHGLAAAGEQLAEDAAFFAERGFRVLLPDLRGHGRSGKPADTAAPAFSIARMADDLVEMLDRCDAGPVHWVGNSLGGILALHMIGEHEHRLRSLATFGTAYRLQLPAAWASRMIPLGYSVLGARLAAALTARATTHSLTARPMIAKLVRNFDPAVGAAIAGQIARYDLVGNAIAARIPILLMRGGRDRGVNLALRPTLAAMRDRPNFVLTDLPEGGHCANLDATDAWREVLLRFWAGSSP